MAEGEGFEPPVPFQAQRFSRPPVSTAHPSLRGEDLFDCKAKRAFQAGSATGRRGSGGWSVGRTPQVARLNCGGVSRGGGDGKNPDRKVG